jgi:hypothetical protein
MPNESQATYSIGQQLKAESFGAQIRKDWSKIRPRAPRFLPGAMQIEDRTAADQQVPKGRSGEYDKVAFPTRIVVPPGAILKSRQRWDGIILECNRNRFVARITDRTDPSNPEEIATFETDEISDDDRPLIKPGAAFYWTIGREKTPAGQIRNIAIINFRRTPRWKKESFKRASGRARKLLAIISSE